MLSAEGYIKSTPSYFFGGNEETIEREDLLEFRLLYAGPVHASSNKNTHTAEKHAIRRAFHPQLRRLWHLHSGLRQLAVNAGNQAAPRISATDQERFDAGLAAIGKTWSRIGFDFIPLVTDKHALRCALDITLLRPEEEKYIYRAGDIDGQLKTFF